MPSVYSERLSADRNRLGPDFWPVLVETFNSKWFKQPIQRTLFDFSPFEDEEIVPAKESYDSGFLSDIAKNRNQAERIDSIDFGNHGVQIQLVSDVEVTGEAGTTLLDEKNKIKYSKKSSRAVTYVQ